LSDLDICLCWWSKKATKVALDARWVEEKGTHAPNLEEHEKLSERLLQEGWPKKDLPKKPRMRLKAEVEKDLEQERAVAELAEKGEGEGAEGMEKEDDRQASYSGSELE
jgi:hypothetical protein